jgi:hypothetical protein
MAHGKPQGHGPLSFLVQADCKPWVADGITALRPQPERRRQRETIFRDSPNALQVRCVCVEYEDFPILEWTLYFKNIGSTDHLSPPDELGATQASLRSVTGIVKFILRSTNSPIISIS